MPGFVGLLTNHRPKSLRGKSLAEVLATPDRQPQRLARLYQEWQLAPAQMRAAPPTLALAVIGQAKADDQISPEAESRLVGDLLTYWALRRTLTEPAACTRRPEEGVTALSV